VGVGPQQHVQIGDAGELTQNDVTRFVGPGVDQYVHIGVVVDPDRVALADVD